MAKSLACGPVKESTIYIGVLGVFYWLETLFGRVTKKTLKGRVTKETLKGRVTFESFVVWLGVFF